MSALTRFDRFAFVLLLVACAAHGAEPAVRPIDDADTVLAVYTLQSRGEPRLILAIWADGQVVWSDDRLKGGPPYRTAKIAAKRFEALLQALAHDGIFADKDLSNANVGPDSAFTTIVIRSGSLQLEMRSWHELYEANQKTAAASGGIVPLDGRRRLDVLKGDTSKYLFYRMVWSEIRLSAAHLIPSNGAPAKGRLVINKGSLSWQEEPSETQRSNAEALKKIGREKK